MNTNGMSAGHVTAPDVIHWPITVVLRREMKTRQGWQFPAWSLQTLEAGGTGEGVEQVRIDDGIRDFRWQGLSLVLYRSGAETYWFNLTSQKPSVFVICREDPQFGLMPSLVTLDQDESMRQQESEAEIFACAMPDWLIDPAERFVLAHFKPGPRKRRRKPQEADDELG